MSASLVTAAAAELVLGLVMDTNQADIIDRIRPRWLFWRGLLHAAAGATGFRFLDRSVPILVVIYAKTSHQVLLFETRK